MKKISILLVGILFLSCSKDSPSDNSIKTVDGATTMQSKTVLISSTNAAACAASQTSQTADLEIAFSEPVANDMMLFFRVYELTSGSGGWSEIPGELVEIEAGDSYITVDTSCFLPSYVQCGSTTGVYSSSFKYVLDLDQSVVIGGEWDYNFYSDGETVITAYRYCLGGGWDDGGGPGGLH